MANIQVGGAQRSHGHCDGRRSLDARTYRAGFKPRKVQVSMISLEARGDLAWESGNCFKANCSNVADCESVSYKPRSEQQRVDIEINQHMFSCGGGDINAQESSRSPQKDETPTSGNKEGEDLDVDKNGVGTSIEQSPSPLQGSPQTVATADSSLRFKEYWVPVHLSDFQLEQYCSTLIANSMLLSSSSKNVTLDHLHGILNELKKCCDHPYLLDSSLQGSVCGISNDILSAGIEVSGKIQLLSKFLPEIKNKGLRVLILYKTVSAEKNFLKLGDILDDFVCQTFGRETYIHIYGGGYCRQGSIAPKELQTALDLFNAKDKGRFVVLVEHSRSFRGIRLSSMDIVILFNSSWNPVYDIRALRKMTLETKCDHLRVLRLYSSLTLEEKALVLAKEGKAVKSNMDLINFNVCHLLLISGAAYLFTKLDELHGSKALKSAISPEKEFLQCLLLELSTILSSNSNDDTIRLSLILDVNKGSDGCYENIRLDDEHEIQSPYDKLPHLFWASFLQDKCPQWKFLPEKSMAPRRRILSYTSDKMFKSEIDVPRRKRKDVLKRSEESFSPKQILGEGGIAGPLTESRKLAGSSGSSASNGIMSSSSSKNDVSKPDSADYSFSSAHMVDGIETAEEIGDLFNVSRENHTSISIGNIEETLKKRRIGKNNLEAEILEYFMVKEKGKKILEEECRFQSDETITENEDLKKLYINLKEKLNQHNHKMDKLWQKLKAAQREAMKNSEMLRTKCMASLEENIQMTTPENSHHELIDLASLPVTSDKPNSSLICASTMEFELGVGPNSNVRNNVSPVATSCSEPIENTTYPQEIILGEKDGSFPCNIASKSLSMERNVILLDSDEEQINPISNPACSDEPANPTNPSEGMNSAKSDTCTELLNQISAVKPSLSLSKGATEFVSVDSDVEQIDVLAPNLLEPANLVRSSANPSEHLCNGLGKVPETCYEQLTCITGRSTISLNSGDEQISPISSPVCLDVSAKLMPSSANQSDDYMSSRLEEAPNTSIEQIHHGSSQKTSREPSPCISSGLNQTQDEENSSKTVRFGKLGKQNTEDTPLEFPLSLLTGSCTSSVDPEICIGHGRSLPLEQHATACLPCSEVRFLDTSSAPNSLGNGVDSSNQQPKEVLGPLQGHVGSFDPLSSLDSTRPTVARNVIPDVNSNAACSEEGENYLQLGSSLRNDNSAYVWRDPLLFDIEKVQKAEMEAVKKHEHLVMHLKSSYEKELAELNRKYDTLLQNAKVVMTQKGMELSAYSEKAYANELLAEALRQANNMGISEPSEVTREDSCTSSLQTLQLSSLLQGPANPTSMPTNPRPVWAVNQFRDLISPGFFQPPQNPIMHLYENSQPASANHASGPYILPPRPSEIRSRLGFSTPLPRILLGEQSVNSQPPGSLTSSLSHQLNGDGGFPVSFNSLT